MKLIEKAADRAIDRAVERYPRSSRRHATAWAMEKPFPYTVEQPTGGLDRAEALLENGTGLIFVAPHASLGDSNRLLEMILLESPVIRQREIVIPVAHHQIDKNFLPQLGKLADLRLVPVVTDDTIRKEETLARRGKTQDWQHHEKGHGNLQYLKEVVDVIGGHDGTVPPGIAVVFPQAGRRPELSSWAPGTPIATTDGFLQRRGKSVAYVFVGMDMGVDDYTKAAGLNLGKKYKFTIGDVLTSEELRASAQEQGLTVDEEVRRRMLAVAPEAYKPKGS